MLQREQPAKEECLTEADIISWLPCLCLSARATKKKGDDDDDDDDDTSPACKLTVAGRFEIVANLLQPVFAVTSFKMGLADHQ